VPATVLITEPFQSLAQRFAQTLGTAGYHAAVVPHPISSKDAEHLRALAGQVAGTVAGQLVDAQAVPT
jgi:hypothetical protein